MSVLANRFRAGWGSWSDIIDNIPKTSALKVMPTGSPEIWSPEFVKLLHEVDGIFDGSVNYAAPKDDVGTINKAFYWADLRFIENDWFYERILDQPDLHPKIADMNSLALFK